MAHLYLHIGTPKAGSSSIQNFLLQEGPGSPFEYIDSCGGLCGHKFLSVPSFRGQVAPEIEARIPRKYRLSGLQDIAWDQIEAEIRANFPQLNILRLSSKNMAKGLWTSGRN